MALNGFSVCNPSGLDVYRVPGTRRSLLVRAEIAPLLIGFAAEFNVLVEKIDNGQLDDWGYACRNVRGRGNISFHAAGLAVDLNSLRHQLGHRGTFNAKQVSIIKALCRKYGLRWGGGFRRPDEMHVEVILPRHEALALVARLQSHPVRLSRPARVKSHVKTRVVAYRGLGKYPLPVGKCFGVAGGDFSGNESGGSRAAVGRIEAALNRTLKTKFAADGRYDKSTLAWVKVFQRKHGLVVDGRVGPKTWAALNAAALRKR